MISLDEYLTSPSLFTKEISFIDYDKKREIVTYDGSNGSILRKEHKSILSKLESLPTSHNSYAYKKGVKILDAIKSHLGNVSFLKLDIKGYFEHIDCELLARKIKERGVDIKLEYCFYNNKLPIGFITSPRLSDFYLYELDKAAEEYAKQHPGLVYSRYSDDFLLSSPSNSLEDVSAFGSFICQELQKYHLEINQDKLKKTILSKQTSVRFLGLNIGLNKVTISKWYILRTIDAFKRYHLALFKMSEDAILLKSIAFGLFNFIEQNSEIGTKRFLRKYQNTFGHPFSAESADDNCSAAVEKAYIANVLDDIDKVDIEKVIKEAPLFHDFDTAYINVSIESTGVVLRLDKTNYGINYSIIKLNNGDEEDREVLRFSDERSLKLFNAFIFEILDAARHKRLQDNYGFDNGFSQYACVSNKDHWVDTDFHHMLTPKMFAILRQFSDFDGYILKLIRYVDFADLSKCRKRVFK